MFKIGEFSKLSMVTVKTLRFYDEEGLIKPARVDKFTGYRYYTTAQLYDINRIVSLRQAGLSVSEIKSVITADNAYEILTKRKELLQQEFDRAEMRLKRITELAKNFKENNKMKFQATVKKLEEYCVFYGVRKLHSFADFNDFIVKLGEECAAANPALKCVTPEYCFVSYLDDEFTPVDFTAMFAQAVEKEGTATQNVKFKTMPATEAVSVIVRGDYEKNLPLGYAFIVDWIEKNGYKITDKARECYIDGVWNKENPDDYITEIQFPVERA